MYARLIQLAKDATAKAEEYDYINAGTPSYLAEVKAKTAFYLGQASGLRQAAFMAQIEEDLL